MFSPRLDCGRFAHTPGKDVEQIVAVLDEVGNGIFAELDFEIEAQSITSFRQMYAKQLDSLGVVVPEVVGALTSTRVLVTEVRTPRTPRAFARRSRHGLGCTL